MSAGHQVIDAAKEARLASVIHMASQGSAKEVQAWLNRKPTTAADAARGDYDGALNQL